MSWRHEPVPPGLRIVLWLKVWGIACCPIRVDIVEKVVGIIGEL